MTAPEIEEYVETTLNWAEKRMKFHEKKEDFRTCLAIAQEFHEWCVLEDDEEYCIICVAVD
jgi:hypothetical protein